MPTFMIGLEEVQFGTWECTHLHRISQRMTRELAEWQGVFLCNVHLCASVHAGQGVHCPLSITKYFSLLNINTNNNNFMFRFDGFEQTAFIIGTALSPVIFKLGGFEAAFRWVNDLFVTKLFVFGHNIQ